MDVSGLTYREFAGKIGYSHTTVNNYSKGTDQPSGRFLEALADKLPDETRRAGYNKDSLLDLLAQAQGFAPRTGKPPGEERRPTRAAGWLPLVGASACGPWLEIIKEGGDDDGGDWMLVGRKASSIPNAFLVTARGDSMTGETPSGRVINDGDILLVDPTREASNGRVALVIRGSETTIKVFHRTKSEVVLVPTNPKHKTITVKAGEWKRENARAFPVRLLEFESL